MPELWGSERYRLYCALVSVDNDIFRKIVLRESRVAQIDPRNFTLQKWTEKSYYEVCTDPAIYTALEDEKASAARPPLTPLLTRILHGNVKCTIFPAAPPRSPLPGPQTWPH